MCYFFHSSIQHVSTRQSPKVISPCSSPFGTMLGSSLACRPQWKTRPSVRKAAKPWDEAHRSWMDTSSAWGTKCWNTVTPWNCSCLYLLVNSSTRRHGCFIWIFNGILGVSTPSVSTAPKWKKLKLNSLAKPWGDTSFTTEDPPIYWCLLLLPLRQNLGAGKMYHIYI